MARGRAVASADARDVAWVDAVADYVAVHPANRVWITGYGRADQAPEDLTPIFPGDVVTLSQGAS